MNIVSQMNILFSPNFVGIINSFLSYVKISGKKKKKGKKKNRITASCEACFSVLFSLELIQINPSLLLFLPKTGREWD